MSLNYSEFTSEIPDFIVSEIYYWKASEIREMTYTPSILPPEISVFAEKAIFSMIFGFFAFFSEIPEFIEHFSAIFSRYLSKIKEFPGKFLDLCRNFYL